MICFIVVAVLARAAGATEFLAMQADSLTAFGLWVLCDIELLRLIFGKGR